MAAFDFKDTPLPIRPDLPEAFHRVWEWIAKPGCWWSAAERVAIVEEARAASHCALCAELKQALSPAAGSGQHERVGSLLPEAAIEAVHRLINDAARLSKTWLDACEAHGLSDAKYVELLGVTVLSLSIDRFHEALSLDFEPLPRPLPGRPSCYRPASARTDVAWVPMIAAGDARGEEADLYQGAGSVNVLRALSLVPDCVRQLKQLSGAMYLPLAQLADVAADPGRALERPQIELLAGRVSAKNECFY